MAGRLDAGAGARWSGETMADWPQAAGGGHTRYDVALGECCGQSTVGSGTEHTPGLELPSEKVVGSFGWCYDGMFSADATASLGKMPSAAAVAACDVDADDEFGEWAYHLPDSIQVNHNIQRDDFSLSLVTAGNKAMALHAGSGLTGHKEWALLADAIENELCIGAKLSDLVAKAGQIEGELEEFAFGVLSRTSELNADAADNYARMGDYMEEIHARGGLSTIAEGNFITVCQSLISRWATAREATAAARLAAALVFNGDEPWSPQIFEEAMEIEEDETDKQSRLLRMAGLAFARGVSDKLEDRRRRKLFSHWKADALAPAKAFCRVVGVSDGMVDEAVERGIKSAVPYVAWAARTLQSSALPAAKVLGTVAAGGAVAAAVFAAAGLVMDWYYVDSAKQRLGPVRETLGDDLAFMNHVHRARQLFAVGAAVSDEVYDCTTHTQIARVDPFFFTIKSDVSRMKDDTGAQRMLTNTVLPPLLQSISTQNKTVVKLPATISEESARHFQEAMPEFYFRIVNRSHSHPELWAARRGFELMVSRNLVGVEHCPDVVMIGGNVRQASKIPGVVANFGPVLSGRDDFRQSCKGTANQRAFFSQINLPEKFGRSNRVFKNSVGVAFYATQDMHKEDYLRAAIACGIRKHYVAMNIPVIMMDHRITQWDDAVLNARYVRRDGVLSMSPLSLPVAGYDNDFAATMSWVKPHRPFLGYDVTISALAQIGSTYLLEVDIGAGPQESYDTIWRMPDAGYYLLHDLTKEAADMRFYTVPAAKFDQVVKFVIQLSGAKNVIEATAGRILGLEAQIKIGGVTLERAWHMSHREFASTMVHAIMCAGLSKSDAIAMMGKLRQHFSEPGQRTWLTKALDGYRKLFGLQGDVRKPGKADRGASDYDPVTHWTARQRSGVGFGESFVPTVINTGPRKTKVDDEQQDVPDEGYCSAENLNSDDAPSEASDEEETKAPFIERLAKILRPSAKRDTPKTTDDFRGFEANSATMQLIMDPDEALNLRTNSQFCPGGVPAFGDMSGSLANTQFMLRCGSVSDLEAMLVSCQEFAAPDSGAAFVVSKAMETARKQIHNPPGLHRFITGAPASGAMEELQEKFFSEITEDEHVAVPQLLVDGIAGSAKSSMIRTFIAEHRQSAAIVCPTRALAKDWRKHKSGACVTKHKLMLSTLRGRAVLVIDEVYAYTKAELHGLLWKANQAGCKVVLLGDRRQQFEDGGEITPSDLALGMPVMRCCVSNTMPVDALKIAKWAAEGDPFAEFFQTRSAKVHSICVRQKDQIEDKAMMLDAVKADNCLVYKDRLGPELQYTTITDRELGFEPGDEEAWLSVSRTQGLRTQHAMLCTSRFTKAISWFAEQPGLFYVATSRHSSSMMIFADQFDLNKLTGLSFGNMVTVEGRLSALQARENFSSPHFILKAVIPKDSPVLRQVYQRGGFPQTLKFVTTGPIIDNWRPWHKFSQFNETVAKDLYANAALRLVGDAVPYTQTDAVHMPIYQSAMGLYGVRRPERFSGEKLNTKFLGLDRLAVLQNSKDELLDQKNVIERTARPRNIIMNALQQECDANSLFEAFKRCYLDEGKSVHFSSFPSAQDWAESRTSEFASKLEKSDPYGATAYSVRSQGFLKTQVKVKLKRTFATEENYGQTVLASPADFNAMFGPWSKMFLRNLRLLCREGVIMDSGYSDKELARAFRSLGVQPRFQEENYQADVKRQDTSHTPVTLKVFCKLLAYCGVPEELCDLYELHSSKYEYASMHAGLYRGEARYNLGSGDPFTLIRNIVEVLTVMLERFGDQLMSVNMVVKGDDYLADKIMTQLPMTIPEIRATQLTEDFNKPPYHAGRFFLENDVVPDPVRMVAKILVKQSNSIDRVNQLAESFYDRYVHLTDYSYEVMRKYVVQAYSDFEPEFPLSSLDLYHALRDRNLFFELLCDTEVSETEKLVVLNYESDCARRAAAHFCSDPSFLSSIEHEPVDIVEAMLTKNSIPNFRVTGRPNDFLKRGVWLTNDHAWAVIGLTEFKEETNAHGDHNHD